MSINSIQYFGSFVEFFEDCTKAPEIISMAISSTVEAVTNFRTFTRAQVDNKFKSDITKLCSFAIPKSASDALNQCQVGSTVPKTSVLIKELMTLAWSLDSFTIGMREVYKRLNRYAWGANTYWQFVHDFGKILYDADSTVPGEQPSIPSVTKPDSGARDNR